MEVKRLSPEDLASFHQQRQVLEREQIHLHMLENAFRVWGRDLARKYGVAWPFVLNPDTGDISEVPDNGAPKH